MNQQQTKVEESIDELQRTLSMLQQNPEGNKDAIKQIEEDIHTLQSVYNKVKKMSPGEQPLPGMDAMQSLLLEFREPSVSDQINFIIWLHADSQQRNVDVNDAMFAAINKSLHGCKWMIASMTRELAGLPSNQPSNEVRDLLDAMFAIQKRLENPGIISSDLDAIRSIVDTTIEKVTGVEEVSHG